VCDSALPSVRRRAKSAPNPRQFKRRALAKDATSGRLDFKEVEHLAL
jgi:hypothetical protein